MITSPAIKCNTQLHTETHQQCMQVTASSQVILLHCVEDLETRVGAHRGTLHCSHWYVVKGRLFSSSCGEAPRWTIFA